MTSYNSVREWLTTFVIQHNLNPGDRIPSERVMAEALNLSRPTIARATARLVESGMLRRGPGRSGTYVAAKAGSLSRTANASRNRTIGLIMQAMTVTDSGPVGESPSISPYDEYFSHVNISRDIVQGVLSVVQKAGCRLLVHHNDSADEEQEAISNLAKEPIDGAIVMPWMSAPSCWAATADIALPPIVFVDRYIPGIRADRAVTDNVGGTKQAVSALIAKGHTRIALFTDYTPRSSLMDREAGYRAAMEEASIIVDEELICGPSMGRDDHRSLNHALYFCTHRPDPVTAAFGTNDDLVWSALQAAKKLGLNVPGDIEIAGFFDTPILENPGVPFTRVVQRTYEMGQAAAQLILDRIEGKLPSEPQCILVPTDIMPTP